MATRYEGKTARWVRGGADITVFSSNPPAAGAAVFAGNSLATITTAAVQSGSNIYLSPMAQSIVVSHNIFRVMSINAGTAFTIGVVGGSLTLTSSYRVGWRLDVPV